MDAHRTHRFVHRFGSVQNQEHPCSVDVQTTSDPHHWWHPNGRRQTSTGVKAAQPYQTFSADAKQEKCQGMKQAFQQLDVTGRRRIAFEEWALAFRFLLDLVFFFHSISELKSCDRVSRFSDLCFCLLLIAPKYPSNELSCSRSTREGSIAGGPVSRGLNAMICLSNYSWSVAGP